MSANDGVTVLHRISITLKNQTTPFRLIPIGDVHRHSPACAIDVWRADLRELKRTHTPNTYYLGLGDFDDFMSGTERKLARDMHDSTLGQFNAQCDGYVDALAEELAFTKGQWLGMLQGNHHWNYGNGITTTHKLCAALGAKFLGDFGYISCRLCRASSGRQSVTLDIVCAHGKAGGKLAGTSVNQVDDLKRIFPEADIYIMGHNHDRGAWPTTSLRVTQGGGGQSHLVHKEQWLVRSGSYLRGYTPNRSSYVASRLLRPTSLGHVTIEAVIQSPGEKGHRVTVPHVRATA